MSLVRSIKQERIYSYKEWHQVERNKNNNPLSNVAILTLKMYYYKSKLSPEILDPVCSVPLCIEGKIFKCSDSMGFLSSLTVDISRSP